MRKARILVVDDTESMRRRVIAAVREIPEVGEIDGVGDGFAALQAMRLRQPDLILCDVVMPRCDGLRFLQLRAQSPSLAETPVLMLTSLEDLELRMRLFDAGASDYIPKPWDERELRARVRVHLRSKLQRDELSRLNAQLEELTCRDSLTGVHNRRHFDAVLTSEVAKVSRTANPLSLVLVDIDDFKQVNDRLGHVEGDAVLRATAGLLEQTARSTDVVARFGGEEFAVLLPATTASGARILAERLRARMAASSFASARGPLQVSASFGVATALPTGDRIDASLLVQRADSALYDAKRGGKNRVRSWGDPKRTLRPESGGRDVRDVRASEAPAAAR